MKKTKSISVATNEPVSKPICMAVFIITILPGVLILPFLKNSQLNLFHCVLFALGWFTWTFIEYVWHRFYTHTKKEERKNKVYDNHLYHHTHPAEIKITAKQRAMMVLISAALITISVILNNYFTFIAGLWMGINCFFLIHYSLHQQWAPKIFPGLVRFHMIHHCKNPDSCFCFSLTFWDTLFNTSPPDKLTISPRIIDFYFGERPNNIVAINKIVDKIFFAP